MNAPTAARRPNRAAAIVVLLLMHGAAIEWLLHLQARRDVDDERLTSLLLLPTPPRTERTASPSLAPPPRVLPRPMTVPLPSLDLPAPDGGVVATPAAPPPPAEAGPAPAAASAPLDLRIPKSFFDAKPAPLTPAQEAMRDPRSNHLELTRQEKLDIAFGVIECVAGQREPDGSIYRGPGHLREVRGALPNPSTPAGQGASRRPKECVK